MERKIDAGALLVAGAALLLVISLSLDWFGPLSAWEAFEVLDLVLLGAAILAVAAAFGRADQRLLGLAAGVAVAVVATQVLGPPPAGRGLDRETGAWLGLLGALGLLAGAALTSAQIAVTVDVKGRERRQRVAAVDKRGAEGGSVAKPLFDDGEPTRATGSVRPAQAEPARAGEPRATEPTQVDRFAPPADPDATQAFSQVDEPER